MRVSEWVSECLYLSGWFTLTRKQQREDNKQMLQPHQRWQKYTKMIKKKRRKIGVQTQKKSLKLNQPETDNVTQSVLVSTGQAKWKWNRSIV